MRITKKEFYDLGGLSHPRTYRRMVGGVWKYYIERS